MDSKFIRDRITLLLVLEYLELSYSGRLGFAKQNWRPCLVQSVGTPPLSLFTPLLNRQLESASQGQMSPGGVGGKG